MNYIKTLHDQVNAMLKAFVQHLPALAIAIVVLTLTWLAAKFAVRIADRLTRDTHMRENLKQLIETLVRLAIWVVGIMIAAMIAMPGITPASIFAGLGIGALAVGFAFQDIFQNFLAGVLIMVRDRMRIGDSIVCEKISGKVERITLRETHIRNASNELTIVPNSVLFKNPVLVQTDLPQRRFELIVGVASAADLERAGAVMKRAVDSVEGLDRSRPVEVFAQDIKPGAVDYVVHWWSNQRALDGIIKDKVIKGIKAALDEAGFDLAGAAPTAITLEQERLPELAIARR